MSTPLDRLHLLFRQAARIDHAVTYLSWDQMVMMPPQGVERRSSSIGELSAMRHSLLSNPAIGEWLRQAEEEATSVAVQADLREMRREWRASTVLPEALVRRKIEVGSRCEHGWRSQRGNNDWKGFLKNFRDVVAASREEARLRHQADPERLPTPYDALLDLHCAGDTSERIDSIFDLLKAELPVLLDAILNHPDQNVSPDVRGAFPLDAQKTLNERLMAQLGFDFSAGRLDVSAHPFSTGERGDLRITTRFQTSKFVDALCATAHETGHSAYEGGLPETYAGLPIGRARSMCLHESQSLLFEKHIFLSLPFFTQFVSSIHELLPDARRYSADTLWSHCTAVGSSLIRVEADEVTYPLHVVLRYEIEKLLINGEIEPDDIPSLWDQKMQHYLGLSTTNDYRNGCLQDIHWTDGAFGYFPSYTLGAVNAAQLFATIRDQCPDWESRLLAGDVQFVRNWLAENVWQIASQLESQQLMVQATGAETDARRLISHLKARYLPGESA